MEGAYQATLKISGMHCNNCVESVEQALTKLDGVHKVTVDLGENEATVMYEDDKAEPEDFKEAVKSAGYSVEDMKEQ